MCKFIIIRNDKACCEDKIQITEAISKPRLGMVRLISVQDARNSIFSAILFILIFSLLSQIFIQGRRNYLDIGDACLMSAEGASVMGESTRGGFNLSPIILYPLRAIIAVS